MIWEPRAVYGFVRAAGFRDVQWGPAVALALTVSAGDDLYRDAAFPGPSVDRRGLFGIDALAHPELGDRDLFNPRDNCRAAYALSVAAQGDWGWAGAMMPPTSSEAFTVAKAAVRAGPAGQAIPEDTSALWAHPERLAAARELAGISDYVRSRILSGG